MNFCYKFSPSLDREKISEKQKVACSYHFITKGVNKNRDLHKRKAVDEYKEEEDFDAEAFDVDYDDHVKDKEEMEKEINGLENNDDENC